MPRFSICQSDVNARDAPLVCFWTNYGALELAFELLVATSMIPVVMGVENVIKLETPALT